LRFAAQCQEEEGYFVHRHFPDGSVGSTWHPPPFIQVDQTASVLDAAAHHFRSSGSLDGLLPLWQLVRRGADFLMRFVDEKGLPRPSYDLWEERKSVNAYSVAAVVGGLRSAAAIGRALAKRSDFWAEAADRMHQAALAALWNPERHCFLKASEPRDDTIDAASLLALLNDFLRPEDPRFAQVVGAVEDRLWSKAVGGVARYEGDRYYGGENPWIICTLWLARCHLLLGNTERCRELIEWCAAKAGPTALLPEQIDATTGEHTSVTPLVWSHSTFVEAVNAYVGRTRTAPPVPIATVRVLAEPRGVAP
jgi:GH15 family glucan-1,4-alpha-glucosidase